MTMYERHYARSKKRVDGKHPNARDFVMRSRVFTFSPAFHRSDGNNNTTSSTAQHRRARTIRRSNENIPEADVRKLPAQDIFSLPTDSPMLIFAFWGEHCHAFGCAKKFPSILWSFSCLSVADFWLPFAIKDFLCSKVKIKISRWSVAWWEARKGLIGLWLIKWKFDEVERRSFARWCKGISQADSSSFPLSQPRTENVLSWVGVKNESLNGTRVCVPVDSHGADEFAVKNCVLMVN